MTLRDKTGCVNFNSINLKQQPFTPLHQSAFVLFCAFGVEALCFILPPSNSTTRPQPFFPFLFCVSCIFSGIREHSVIVGWKPSDYMSSLPLLSLLSSKETPALDMLVFYSMWLLRPDWTVGSNNCFRV